MEMIEEFVDLWQPEPQTKGTARRLFKIGLQAIMDKTFEEQREKCFSVYENGYLKNESHLMQQDNLLMAPQPETGIEL